MRLPDEFGSDEFWAAYHAAEAGDPAPSKRAQIGAGTVAWLVERYMESQAYGIFRPGTKEQRERILRKLVEDAGAKPFRAIEKKHIGAAIDKRQATPFAAHTWLKTVRCVFQWALTNGHISSDPTQGHKVKRPQTEGFHCWTPDEVERFKSHWPIGTRERLAFVLLNETGLRRADIVNLGRQHVGTDGFIKFKTSKNNAEVVIAMSDELQRAVSISPTGDLIFFATLSGRPMKATSFGNWFGEVCVAAGVPGRAHGVRKRRATDLLEDGWNTAQLNATMGWKGDRMASYYTQKADKEKLVRDAPKLGTRTSAPFRPVRTAGDKDE